MNSSKSERNVSKLDVAVALTTFCAGYIWSLQKFENVYKNPLTSTINGCFCGLGVTMVTAAMTDFLPIAKIPFILSCGASIAYYGHKLVKS